MPELLCPAGSKESLIAAVQSGADAVYMGFGAFNARRNAKNFTDEEFASAISYCHLRGVKVYLTLNTLLSDRELSQAADILRLASNLGVDAVLVQDWGVWHLAREVAPDLPLHASTQMSLFTLGGANMAAELGMERVVLARELSQSEIKEICQGCSAEIEVFVHGALCMCYSGQCAMSALIGRRSGNRGVCAQPCRLPYGVNGPCRTEHPLSLKDANLSGYLKELTEMGVACLKLEGRMKRPEYVAAITSIYRRLLDENRQPTKLEANQLRDAFSRNGFTQGYFLAKKGPEMFGIRPENTKWPEQWFSELRDQYEKEDLRSIPVTFSCQILKDQPSSLLVSDGAHQCTVYGPIPEIARNRALTGEDLQARLSKTGGTAYHMAGATIRLDDGLMLSAGSINALRRDALEALSATRLQLPARATSPTLNLPSIDEDSSPVEWTISISSASQITPALLDLSPSYVYIPWDILSQVDLPLLNQKAKVCAVLPRVFRTKDEHIFRDTIVQYIDYLDAVAISNLGHLTIVHGLNLELRGDLGLNVFNSRALLFLKQLGLSSAALSFELRREQVRDVIKYLPCESVVYGRLPFMITENCVTKNSVGCTHGGGSTLTDRTGTQFPVLCAYGCRNEIQNSLPIWLADKLEDLQIGLRYARLRFTTESPDECVQIFKSYLGKDTFTPEKFTRGLFYRGVD